MLVFFQESGWLLFPGSSPDYWTHGFLMKAFHENLNVMSYYAEDTLVLYYIYKRTQAVCAKRLYQKQDNSFFKSYISISSMSSKTQ